MRTMKKVQFSTGGNFYDLYLEDSEFAHVLQEGELYDGTAVAAVQIDNLIYTIHEKLWREKNAIQQETMPSLRGEAEPRGESSLGLEELLQEAKNERIRALQNTASEYSPEITPEWWPRDPEGGASK